MFREANTKNELSEGLFLAIAFEEVSKRPFVEREKSIEKCGSYICIHPIFAMQKPVAQQRKPNCSVSVVFFLLLPTVRTI